MFEFLRRNQVLLGSALFLTLSLILLSANRSGARRFDPLGVAFLEVLRPLQSGTTRATSAVGHLWSRYVSLVGVETENRELKERLRRLEGEHLRDSEVELENRRLAGLLDFKWEMPSQVVTARVIGKDASGIFESFTLDRGETDGIKPGMAVVCAEGVVGRIAQSTPHAARVLLISDHNSGVDAIVQRTRARGIVEGAVNRTCSMKYIKRGDEIDVNDVIVTSGLDWLFPKGILIGRVSGVTRKDFAPFQVPVGPILRDLVVILCVYLALHEQSVAGALGAFLLGYFADNFSGDVIGLHAFAMSLIFLLVYLLARQLWMDNIVANVTVVFAASL